MSSSRSMSSDEGPLATGSLAAIIHGEVNASYRPVDGQGDAGVGLQFRACDGGVAVRLQAALNSCDDGAARRSSLSSKEGRPIRVQPCILAT
eukprot:764709-Hanusia_phi.AAC.2